MGSCVSQSKEKKEKNHDISHIIGNSVPKMKVED